MTGVILPYRGIMPKLAADVWIAPTASVIGDVEIGPGSGIWFGCVLRGDVHDIRIGARTNIQDGTVIHVNHAGPGTHIGDDVTVGHMALIHACTLETGSFVGMKACVMDEAVVEQGAMVAAGALVTPGKRVPAGQLWAGSPAVYRRDVTDKELAGFASTAERYAGLAREYLAASR
jgi:carbonic anhydrase/acetyltransferase-like protein (isoleucine patch superfamily)